MSKCGEVVQEAGVTVCEHTYICIYIYRYLHIYIYIVFLMILRLFRKYCKYIVFEHYTYLC